MILINFTRLTEMKTESAGGMAFQSSNSHHLWVSVDKIWFAVNFKRKLGIFANARCGNGIDSVDSNNTKRCEPEMQFVRIFFYFSDLRFVVRLKIDCFTFVFDCVHLQMRFLPVTLSRGARARINRIKKVMAKAIIKWMERQQQNVMEITINKENKAAKPLTLSTTKCGVN